MFPLVVPNRPRRVLIASLLAASMGPLTVLLAGRAAGTSYTGPLVEFISYFLFTSYLCAIVAWVLARIVMRYGARLKQAHDIGSYELLEKLGEGGMGEVWMARHRLLARPAAIKLIRTDLLGADERSRGTLVRRFEREARDTAALGSPHTVDVYDFGVAEGGSFYYVMELLDGESLEAHVQRFGPVDVARAVYLLRQVCHSLSEAHARGLIHRDIKPANIFVCRLGHDDDFVKVLDFGLVKHAEASSAGTLISMEGLPTGTPAYMPPELAMGVQPIDARADIYAFGCVAYWLLTGQPVFKAETSMATMLAHVREQPAPPSQRSSRDLPPALDALVMACLAKDPAARPATNRSRVRRTGGECAGRLLVALARAAVVGRTRRHVSDRPPGPGSCDEAAHARACGGKIRRALTDASLRCRMPAAAVRASASGITCSVDRPEGGVARSGGRRMQGASRQLRARCDSEPRPAGRPTSCRRVRKSLRPSRCQTAIPN